MGIATVAVYYEADKNDLHVALADESYCIGPSEAAESYLQENQIISAAILAGASAGASSNQGRRHNGRCNGDCANCPPHYGYRYGRWYYGHDHVHGCEFGGNKGSGSRD